MDPEVREFARSYRAFQEAMIRVGGGNQLTALGEHVQDVLGVPLDDVEPITEYFPTHQSIDADLALEALLEEYGGKRAGISGPHRQHVDSFMDFLTEYLGWYNVGGVSYERKATGPDSDRRVAPSASAKSGSTVCH